MKSIVKKIIFIKFFLMLSAVALAETIVIDNPNNIFCEVSRLGYWPGSSLGVQYRLGTLTQHFSINVKDCDSCRAQVVYKDTKAYPSNRLEANGNTARSYNYAVYQPTHPDHIQAYVFFMDAIDDQMSKVQEDQESINTQYDNCRSIKQQAITQRRTVELDSQTGEVLLVDEDFSN